MKKIKLLTVIMLLLGVFQQCENPLAKDNATGHLTVLVLSSYYNQVQPGCLVQLIGTEYTDTTDVYGQAYFSDLEPGVYEVVSGLQSVGSAKTRVEVEADMLTSVEMKLISGLLMEPSITIQSPDFGELFAVNDALALQALVSDNLTKPQNILITWESDIDGVLYEGHPDHSGLTKYIATNLKPGQHTITLTAQDEDGHIGRDSVIIDKILPPRVALALVSANPNAIQLSWTKSIDSTFESYTVARKGVFESSSNLEYLCSFSDIDSLSFIDYAPPMADSTVYQIFVKNSSGYSSGSNEIVVPNPGGIIHDITVKYSDIHPTQPWLYIVDNDNKLFILDYEADSIISETSFNNSITYFCVEENGEGPEVYLPTTDGWINIFSDDLSEERLNVNVGESVTSVITDGNGNIFASCAPSPWWENPLRSYRRSDGAHISGNGDFDRCRLRKIPGQNAIIEITFSVSPIDMDYYEFDSAGNFTMHTNDSYHGDHPLSGSIFRISPSGDYLVTGSSAALYSANSSMTYQGMLPRGSYTFSDYEFSSDGSKIYAAVDDERKIVIYDYSTMQSLGEISTKGYPEALYRQGDNLVIICKTRTTSYWDSTYKIGIQVYPLSQ